MNDATDPRWLALALDDLRLEGYAIVKNVLDGDFIERTRAALYSAYEDVKKTVGTERLARAGELGVVRIPFLFSDVFFEYLELSPLLELVDATVGKTGILHLMNGFILPSTKREENRESVFQQSFHRDFPRYMNGYLASINLFFAIDAFREDNGATLVVPGSHQQAAAPREDYMTARAVPIIADAGSLLLFDSTLWHAAGQNASGRDRLAINVQVTRSFFKQQIDYVRAVGSSKILALPERSQQLLGWYTRVVTSLDEYYLPESERVYRRGQG
jgi:ectoine hydroxylase-related dioxygenase (phytanoyl-CoA dioxygenase family)